MDRRKTGKICRMGHPFSRRNRNVMIDKELLDILACPETKEPVHLADTGLIEKLNALIEQGQVSNRRGQKLEKKVDGGLIREDGAFLYPVEDGIPIMLIDEAIPIRELGLKEPSREG